MKNFSCSTPHASLCLLTKSPEALHLLFCHRIPEYDIFRILQHMEFQIVFFYLWGCIYISSEYFNGLILLDLIMILCKIIPLSKYKSSMWWYWRWGLLEVIGFWSGHEVWIVSPFMKRNRASSLLTCTKSRTVFFRQSQDLVSDDDLLATKLLKTTLIFIAG